MGKIVRITLVSFFCLAAFLQLKAVHRAGSELHYECLGSCTYRVWYSYYQACNSATPAVNTVSIAGQGSSCTQPTPLGSWIQASMVDMTPVCPSQTTKCSDSLALIDGVAQYRYYRDYDFCSVTCTKYNVVWESCCRKPGLTSGAQNESWYLGAATIDLSLATCNNSPYFVAEPYAYICAGQSSFYSFKANDPDGDSLVYSLTTCYKDSAVSVIYGPGYTFSSPLGSSWSLAIEPRTGLLSFLPVGGGFMEHGPVCVLVEEYRAGVKLGEISRDVETLVVNCGNKVPSPGTLLNPVNSVIDGNKILVCQGQNFCFDIFTQDLDSGQIVTITWDASIAGATFVDASNPSIMDTISGIAPTARFCWTPLSKGEYCFVYRVEDDNCPFLGRVEQTVIISVQDNPVSTVTIVLDSCLKASYTALPICPSSGMLYQWSGDGNINSNPNNVDSSFSNVYDTAGYYGWSLSVTDTSGNVFMLSDTVYFDVPFVSASYGAVACREIAFIASPANPAYSYLWYGDDGLSSISDTFSHFYSTGGDYGYTLIVVDSMGCESTVMDTIHLDSVQSTMTANVDSCLLVSFFATGSGNGPATYSWTGDDALSSFISAFKHSYPGPGTYTYSLSIQDTQGCTLSKTDSITLTTPAIPLISYNGGILSSTSAATYQWFFNGSPISGATSQNYTPIQNGNYNVTVYDSLGCSASSSPLLGFENEIETYSFELFPNPTNGKLMLKLYSDRNEWIKLKLYSLTGKLVLQERLNLKMGVKSHELDLSELRKGVYFLQLGEVARKVIKF